MMKDPKDVLDKLVEMASVRRIIAAPDCDMIQQYIGTNQPLPDHLKPGWLLSRLSPAEREIIKELTSDMTSDYRPDTFWICKQRSGL